DGGLKHLTTTALEDDKKLSAIEDAYARHAPHNEHSEEDIAIIRELFSRESLGFSYSKSNIIRGIVKTNRALGMSLLMQVEGSQAHQHLHELFLIAANDDLFPINSISEEFIDHLLSILGPIPTIEDHWVQEFLAKVIKIYPRKVISLFTSRIEFAVKNEDWQTRPVPHGPYRSSDFNLLSLQDGPQILDQLLDWSLGFINDYAFDYRFGELVEALCHPFDENITNALRKWVEQGEQDRLHVLKLAIREAQNDFVFNQKEFVIWALGYAQSYGEDALKDLSSTMYFIGISGMRSGVPGEPFQQDINLAKNSERILSKLPRFHPSYKLYSALFEHANAEIDRQKEEGRILDEEDEC
ncbi:XRE family transcriptional regulator, partial [Alcanivorax hongdengensis A-11-3]